MYCITEEKRKIENEEKVVYGIQYNDEKPIQDISVNKADVEQLVQMCNDGKLAPYQLREVVDDFLG